ncbi:hypothetical protein QWY31_06565 [Cytophagales bacterium LB-30]|uniref:Type II toxin-antitoxin system RelE/ParE family toxin n=1 Tax=Shiella aurantiaca TaxID=3058365 RepID=A0ABT8F431_9BACT|nr:hypothetical protein [Shiella aurantiaca]MDN4165155.1 hypothetical protein [Shiella aurantiaca]
MKIETTAVFNKQPRSITDQSLLLKISAAVKDIMNAQGPSFVKGIKKIKGAKYAYRIKIGTYRLGFFVEEDAALLTVIMPRKDIYKKFP